MVLDINTLLAWEGGERKKNGSGFIISSIIGSGPGFSVGRASSSFGDPRKSLPEGRKAETEDEEATGLSVGWPCFNTITSETIWRNHIFLAAISIIPAQKGSHDLHGVYFGER